jgi:hypothetical protein
MKDRTLWEDFVDTEILNNHPRQYFKQQREKLALGRRLAKQQLALARQERDIDKIRVYREKLQMIREKEIKLAIKARELRRQNNNQKPATEKSKQQKAILRKSNRSKVRVT